MAAEPTRPLLELTVKQQTFLATACAFIDSRPSPEELDKLMTLAALQLPEPAVQLLRRRIEARQHHDPPAPASLH